jgi:hypothetical protein
MFPCAKSPSFVNQALGEKTKTSYGMIEALIVTGSVNELEFKN